MMNLLKLYSILLLLLITSNTMGQSIHISVQVKKSIHKDTDRILKIELLSNETCFLNLETNYLGLTNSPNEFVLDIVDTNYNSLLIEEQGSHGHWYMPNIMLSMEQNDSVYEETKKRFYAEKKRNEFISIPKMVLLIKNKKYEFHYKLRLDHTTYHNDISTNSSYYKLQKHTMYYLRLKYYSSNKPGRYYKNRKLFHGAFHSNYVKFYY